MSRTATKKQSMVYVGVRMPKALWKAVDEIVQDVNRREPWRNYLPSHAVRELLSIGIEERQRRLTNPHTNHE